MGDDLGDRMKSYEEHETARRFLRGLPVYARLDGRSFSHFTRHMDRPYDARMSEAMVEAAKGLVGETCARIAYVQSDEISLVWEAYRTDKDRNGGSYFFDGKTAKMTSVLAGLATAHFVRAACRLFVDRQAILDMRPHFDCRVIQMPSRTEVANMLLWRELDATKNAVSMAARTVYSHKALFRKSGNEMQEMLFEKGINFNDYPSSFKRGTFVRRVTIDRAFTEDELLRIPPQHRPAPSETRPRSDLVALDMPRFASVANREAVVFDGANPEVTTMGTLLDEALSASMGATVHEGELEP